MSKNEDKRALNNMFNFSATEFLAINTDTMECKLYYVKGTNDVYAEYVQYKTVTDEMTGAEYTIPVYPENIKVYPYLRDTSGKIRCAIMIAYATIINACNRHDNKNLWQIKNDMRKMTAVTYTSTSSEYLFHHLSECSADSQDMVATALCAIVESYDRSMQEGETIALATLKAVECGYKSLNAYVGSQKTRHEKEVSTEYIQDTKGDLVAINTALASVINDDNAYISPSDGDLTDQDLQIIRRMIRECCDSLTDRQIKIVKMLSIGYQNTYNIASKCKVSQKTIRKDIDRIRSLFSSYFRASRYAYLLKLQEIEHEIAERKKRDNADGHRAGYQKEYRARKRAEKELANV